MDLQAIQDNIEELEQATTSPQNVSELACLYIVEEHLKNRNLRRNLKFNEEVNEVLPAYSKYCIDKRNYCLGNGSEEAVINSLELLCREINDLYISLNSSSDSRKEHRIIKDSIQKLSNFIK